MGNVVSADSEKMGASADLDSDGSPATEGTVSVDNALSPQTDIVSFSARIAINSPQKDAFNRF